MHKQNFFRSIVILCCLFIAPQLHAKKLKIATLAPGGSTWMKTMKQAAKEVAEKTNNRIKFKFYPGGIMGDDNAVLKKMRIGQLHGGVLSSGSIAKLNPDSQIYNLPMVFKNFAEVDYARQRMDQKIIDDFEKKGLIISGISEGGLAYLMSKSPIKTTNDLLQRKIWSLPGNNSARETFSAFNITPIPLSIVDVLTGLQSNMIDTIAIPPVGAIALQWHTQIKYVTNLPLVYAYAALAISKKTFNKLKKQDQKVIKEVMSAAFIKIGEQNRKDNIAAIDALSNQGIKIITPSDDEVSQWYKKAETAVNNIKLSGKMSKETIDTFLTHLNSFRTQQTHLSEQQ
jgi:TRAP-type transport system periplasmic protein